MSMKRLALGALPLLLAGCASSPAAPELQFDAIALGDAPVATAQPSSSAQPEQASESPASSESNESEYAQDRYAEIDIDDQSGDGTMVQIDEISISGSNSFLVIYNNQGLVLSSALVTPQSQPVTVKLQVPITNSQELEAVLYLDDGDGVFDLRKDRPILDYEGELVHEDFDYRVVASDG